MTIQIYRLFDAEQIAMVLFLFVLWTLYMRCYISGAILPFSLSKNNGLVD